MSMTRSLHGIQIAIEGDGDAIEPARRFLDRLEQGETASHPEIRMVFSRGPHRPLPAVTRIFHLGTMDGFREYGGFAMGDGGSTARVKDGGRVVEVGLGDEPQADPLLFPEVLVRYSLLVALRWHGVFDFHSGCIVVPDGRSTLLVGESRSGKSTLALALMELGGSFLADDTVLASLGPPDQISGLPRVFHASPLTVRAHPRIKRYLGAPVARSGKFELDPRVAWPGREVRSVPLPDVVLFPRIGSGEHTKASPIGAAEAYLGLVQAATLLAVEALPGATEQFNVIRRIADGGRAFRVDLGQDILEQPMDVGRRLMGGI